MSHTLTVNTARSNVQTALVAGIAQPYTPKAFPTLTFGETADVTLYLIDAAGSYDARSGAAGYTPRVSVMLPTLQPTSGTFTISDGVETITADYNVSASDLETALNAMSDGAGPFGDQCTVTKFADGTFSILFDTVGDKTELTVSAGGIQPTSAASVLPLVEGDATTREEQLIRILAEPLVFEDSATQIADGWTMTLNANNANILRALAAEQDDMSANYSIDIVSPTSAVDVVARGPVILKQGSFDVAALSGINYPDFPTDETSTTTVTDAIYSVTSTDQNLLVNNDDGATIFLLPASVAGDGKELSIKNIGLGDVTISGSIDGQTSVVLQSAGKPSITIVSDATTWNVI